MFGEMLRKCRNELALTQANVAAKIGLSRQTYSCYENESREPDLKTLSQLADIYHCTTDYLLGRTDNKHEIEEIPESINKEFEQLTQEEITALKELLRQNKK